ncbi:MAG: hypothetical protein ABSG61_00660 [Gemmatimonadales bacterium]
MMAPVASGLVERWAHLYADSKALSAGIMFVHLAGVLGAGGLAIAADRVSLLLPAEAGEHLAREIERLKAVHNWVIAGLALTVATGVLQLFSDLHTYLTAWLFWTKMGLIALLLVNGWVRLKAEQAIETGAVVPYLARFRRTSMVSLVLWFAVLLAGAFLTTVS